jgi:hypothetical protein
MTKQQVLALAAAAQRDGQTVRLDVKRRPYHYIGTVTGVSHNTIQIDGTAHGFGVVPHSGRFFIRAGGVTISDLDNQQESE